MTMEKTKIQDKSRLTASCASWMSISQRLKLCVVAYYG